ncbi:MAG: hypothetical protein K2K28_02865 [Clostridia bacterium]|nr:hypothetical protein [Clostridia bacterium]
MKKISRMLLLLATIVIAAISAICFAACGDENDGGKGNTPDYSAFAGTYKFTKYVHEIGVIRTYNVGDELNGTTLTADYFVITLGDDGKFTVDSPLSENDATVTPYGNQIHGNMTGTWEPVSDSAIKVVIGGEEIRSLLINGNQITYRFNGTGLITHTYYFQKV